MSDLNKAFFTGNLTKNPELKQTGDGKKFTVFTIATNRYVGPGKEDETTYLSCSLFGARAEFLTKYAKKGTRVLVIGSVSLDRYQGNDGKEYTSLKVFVEDVQLMSEAKSGNAKPSGTKQETSTSVTVSDDPFAGDVGKVTAVQEDPFGN